MGRRAERSSAEKPARRGPMSTARRNWRKGSQWPWYRETGKGAAGRGGAGNLVRCGGSGNTEKATGSCPMRLRRETGEGIPSAVAREKQWEDVREMGGHREVGGRATGRCRAGNSARRRAGNGGWGNRWEAAREQRRRKTDVMAPGRGRAEKSASGDESGSAGKPREERRHGKGSRNSAEGGWRGNPLEQAARKRDRPKRPGGKGRADGCPVRQPPAPLYLSRRS